MKLSFLRYLGLGLCALAIGCAQKPSLEVDLPEKYNGQSVEIINYLDSAVLASSTIQDGRLIIENIQGKPTFAAVLIDGETRAFYITEPGKATLTDSVSAAVGTPLNDKFSKILMQLDSLEQYDDMDLYLNFLETNYNDNKTNPIGEYLGLQLIRFSDPSKTDSIVAQAPEILRNSKKAARYINFAHLRAQTSPGKPYVDFEGETADGQPLPLSAFVDGKNYVLVDFWASWCPYCIKELPKIAALNEKFKDQGLTVVGVAVRDLPEDTKASVAKHGISWPVIYSAQRKPYDLYGINGIPEHILIDPQGVIVSRGEPIERIEEWLSENMNKEENKENN